MTDPPVLLLGTRNRKKLLELADLFEPLGLALKTLADFPASTEVEETGATFADNARLKAAQHAQQLSQWVLGEDSGLCVDALGGAPGVHSARYSGPGATDAANNERLLRELRDVPLDRRTAHYVCHMALANPQGEVVAESEDRCCGRILFALHGSGGFGYDPLFEVIEYHCTFGRLSPVVKSCLSHRARAARQLMGGLRVESGELRVESGELRVKSEE
jgi:XTP/dITP diphosphohydrolase